MRRWWDASDEATDALLLVNDSDPAVGVSIAVLGYHAIAKAALEPLSQTTLVDVAELDRAYDDADFTEVGEAIHSATCAALGHDAACRYAQSAVAQFTKDAKEATGRLTRALVSKGMSWPQAIERSADVAGVPISRLGRYASTVSDSNLSRMSVNDHADRVLMEYAQQRGGYESDLVSKSHGRYRHRTQKWDEAEVKRDEAGRFAIEDQKKTQSDYEASEKERIERKERRERRAQQRAQVAAQQQTKTEAKPKERKSGIRPTGGSRSSGIRTKTDHRGEPESVTGKPIVSPDKVKQALIEHPDGVSLDRPLFLVKINGKGALPVVYLDGVTDAVREHLVYQWDAQSIEVLELAPGQVTVTAMFDYGLPDSSAEVHPRSFRYVLPEGLVKDRHVGSEKIPGTRLDNNGNIVEVPLEYYTVKQEIAKAGRPRYRHQQQTWDETEVKRDQRGRFAIEDQKRTQSDYAASEKERLERKARRERRAARVQRYTKQEQTQQRTDEREQTRSDGVRRTGVRPDTKARSKDGVRPNTREAAAFQSAYHFNDGEDPAEWLTTDMVGQLKLDWSSRDTLKNAGFTNENYSAPLTMDVMYDEAVERASRYLVTKSPTDDEYNFYEHNYPHVTMQEARVFATFSKLLPYVTSYDHNSGAEVVEFVGDEMQGNGSRTVSIASAGGVDLSDREIDSRDLNEYGNSRLGEAFANQGIVAPGRDVVMVLQDDEDVHAYTNMPYKPKLSAMVFDLSVAPQISMLRELMEPRPSPDELETARQMAISYINTHPSEDGYIPASATVPQVVRALLSELVTEAMPNETKLKLAKQALAHDRTRPVRLDGVDVFKVRAEKRKATRG